jgi:hypothetical protein
MKRISLILLLVCGVFALHAQEAFTYETDSVAVTSYVSTDDAQATAERLTAYNQVFNSFFRFDPATLTVKLKVKTFESKARFDTYVQRLIGETRDDYVYLHYTNASRSELVGFVDASVKATDAGLAHQAFVQYLRAYIPNPPLWMREGFGIYFESLTYNSETKTATVGENLTWLDTFKALTYGDKKAEALAWDEMLTMSIDAAKVKIQTFYPAAWGFVHYLLESPAKDHNRILWDVVNALDPAASLVDNSEKAKTVAFKWVSQEKVETSMATYYDSKKTFPELVKDGIDLYNGGKLPLALDTFQKAIAASTSSFVPYYYLGLINYDNGSYAKAEEFYLQALEKGANAPLTKYALGVNAFADNRFEKATEFLDECFALDASYEEKVSEIKKRMALN